MTRSCLGDFVSVLNWFNTTQKARADAIIAFDQELLGGQSEAEFLASIQRDRRSFEFGPVVAVSEQHWISATVEMPLSGASLCTRVSACRSRCLSGRRALWGGYSQRSSKQRAPARQMSPTSQFE